MVQKGDVMLALMALCIAIALARLEPGLAFSENLFSGMLTIGQLMNGDLRKMDLKDAQAVRNFRQGHEKFRSFLEGAAQFVHSEVYASVREERLEFEKRGGTKGVMFRLTPRNGTVAEGSPILVHYHGGGGMLGSPGGILPRLIAFHTEMQVFSIEYRLAPENPYPFGVQDSFDALKHIHKYARTFNADPAKIAVIGESAGSLMAVVTCMMARDENLSPPIAAQIPMIPMLSFPVNLRSYSLFGDFGALSRDSMELFWRAYTIDMDLESNPIACFEDPYCSPISNHANYKSLPPTYMLIASFDPLRDDGLLYARRLGEANVDKKVLTIPATHIGAFAIHQDQIINVFRDVKTFIYNHTLEN